MSQNSSGLSIPVPIAQGGTNAITAPAALTSLGAVPLAGGTMSGLLVLSGDPVTALGAATRQYVDTLASGITVKAACYASTTANITTVYANGAAGVGATLTEVGNGAFTTDGTTPPLNARILVQFQTASEENGIYVLNDQGSAGTPYQLTRATDYDTPAEIKPGTLAIINNGTLYQTTSWIQTATVTTIGTDPIVFSQFTAGVGANRTLSNLTAPTDINQDLLPDGSETRDLGDSLLLWRDLFSTGLNTGETAADTLELRAFDVDGVAFTTFITLTANNTPTCAFSGAITSVTQAPLTSNTTLATTEYVDDAVTAAAGDFATRALDNLASVAINTSLISDTDLADNLGSATIRWDNVFAETLTAGHTVGNVLTFSARDVDGATTVDFITATSSNTPTCAIAGSVTGTTQAPGTNTTQLATTAFVFAATGGGGGANIALSNLAGVAINTTLVSDTDITDNLGTQAIRWNNIYAATLQTGDTAADTLQIGAWDVDGAVFVPFFTLTANNTPTAVLANGVTATTQAANNNSTLLATTAYADAQASARASVALNNLAGVAINASLNPGSDNAIDLGTGILRWRAAYLAQLKTGTTAADTLVISARDVDGASDTAFITLTAGNTPTCVLANGVTGTTQTPNNNSTLLATTAYVDAQVSASGANTALSNLAAVAINTTLVSDTDNTDDLGTATVRWKDIYSLTHRTGSSNGNTLLLQARDVDGAAWTTFITLTAANTPTCAIAGATITGGTVSGLASPIVVADGGTGVATLTTAYGTLCAGTTATGNVQTVAPGTAGHVLTSNGSAALPSYQAPAGGGGSLTFIATATASNSSVINFNNNLTSTYDNYLILIENVVPATDAAVLTAQVGTGATPTYSATTYLGANVNYTSSGAGARVGSTTYHMLSDSSNTPDNGAANAGQYTINLSNVNNASTNKPLTSLAHYIYSGSNLSVGVFYSGTWQSTTVLTSIRFQMTSGNISTGIFKLYGYSNS